MGAIPKVIEAPYILQPQLSGHYSIFLEWNITDPTDTFNSHQAVGFAVYRDTGHISSANINWDLPAIDMKGTLSDGFGPDENCQHNQYDGVCEPTLGDWDPRNCNEEPVYQVPHARSCSLSGLQPNTYYRIRIAAINKFGRGPLSPLVQLKTGSV